MKNRICLADGREAVVQKFMGDDRFADTILEFNMYVMGARRNGPVAPVWSPFLA